MEAPKHTGTIAKLFLDHGYGFISPGPGKPHVFFHASALVDRPAFSTLQDKQAVTYDLTAHEKGPRAINVAIAT